MSDLTPYPHVATFPDGHQVLVDLWYDGFAHCVKITVAERSAANRAMVWGPPVEAVAP